MSVTTETFSVSNDGPKGCPVVHGFQPFDPEQVNDPGPATAFAREHAPVFFNPDVNMYVVTKHADVEHVLGDEQTFAFLPNMRRPVPDEIKDLLPDGFLTDKASFFISPEHHRWAKPLAQKAFTAKSARRLLPRIRELVDGFIDDFFSEGRADLAADYARRVPVGVMMAILGVDSSIEHDLDGWIADVLTLWGNPRLTEAEVADIGRRQVEFGKWAHGVMVDRRENPRGEGDFITDLLAAKKEDGTPAFSEDDVLGLFLVSAVAGGETAANLIAQLIERLLLDDGALWKQIDADRSLVPLLVDEGLRHFHVTRMTMRVAARDTEVSGCPIPAGSLVGNHLWSAGRDASVFPDPETFDINRPSNPHDLGFGVGEHYCLGAALARTEVRVAIEALLDRLPNARLESGHEIERATSISVPQVLGGVVATWDV